MLGSLYLHEPQAYDDIATVHVAQNHETAELALAKLRVHLANPRLDFFT
jgi:hypothetical protein